MKKKNNPTPVRLNEELEKKIKEIMAFQSEDATDKISVSDVLKQGINELHKQMKEEQKERKKQKKIADVNSPKAKAFKEEVHELFTKTGGVYLAGKGKYEVHLYQTEKGIYGCLRDSKCPYEELPAHSIVNRKSNAHLQKLNPNSSETSDYLTVDNGILSDDFEKVMNWAILMLGLDNSFCSFDVLSDEQIAWKMKMKSAARRLDAARNDISFSWQMNLDIVDFLNELDYFMDNHRFQPLLPDSDMSKTELVDDYRKLKKKIERMQRWATSEKNQPLPKSFLDILFDE